MRYSSIDCHSHEALGDAIAQNSLSHEGLQDTAVQNFNVSETLWMN